FLRRPSPKHLLARSRRSVKQNAARYASAESTKPLRIAQELDRLRQLSSRFVNAGYVFETDVLFAAVIFQLKPAAPAHSRIKPPGREYDQRERQNRQHPTQIRRQHSGLERFEFDRHVALA